MAKGSFNPDLAKQGGGGLEKGKVRVKTAKIQNVKTDYKANMMYLVLGCELLDDNWQPVREAETTDVRFSFGNESLKHYRPAVAKDASDPNPVAQSDAPDAEGNTFDVLDGEPINKSAAVMVFFDSLVKHGFPKATLDLAWAPAFVGLEFELATYTSKECNEKFGTRLSTKPIERTDDKGNKESVNVTYKVATKWQNPNYLGGAAAGAASTGTSTTAGATAATTAEPAESNEETFTRMIKVVADRKKGQNINSQSALHGFVTNAGAQANPKVAGSRMKAIQDLSKDPKAVAKALLEIGVPVEIDDDSGEPKPVTYPIAIPA